MQAVVAFAVCGGLRKDDLVNLKFSLVNDHGTMYSVKVPAGKTPVLRSFVIEGEFYDIVKRYFDKRVPTVHDRVFMNFRIGKCTVQPIGKNKIAKMPREIAEFLNLPNPELYTGHSFRRTSSTLLVDAGADLLTLKRHGGWKSDKVAEGYVAASMRNKKRTCGLITQALNLAPSTSTSTATITPAPRIEVAKNANTLTNFSPITAAADEENVQEPSTSTTVFPRAPQANNDESEIAIQLPREQGGSLESTQGQENVTNEPPYKKFRSSESVVHRSINFGGNPRNTDLIIPDNFFDEDVDFKSMNVKSNNPAQTNKNPIFQIQNCNVTININNAN